MWRQSRHQRKTRSGPTRRTPNWSLVQDGHAANEGPINFLRSKLRASGTYLSNHRLR